VNLDTAELIRRLRYCDDRWTKAIMHRKYRDEETELTPFTDEERRRYWWADTWRNLFHSYESALYKQRDIRLGMIEGLTGKQTVVEFEDD
jgi:hypothetical protein